MAKPRNGRIGRQFTQPVAVMLQRMRTMHAHYETHQAAFAGLSPQQFGAGFGPAWQAAIDAGEQVGAGSARAAELQEDTTAVGAVLAEARAGLQLLYYFVGLAYPANAGRQQEYGRTQYLSARNNAAKMRTVLELAVAGATRDKTALAAVGYTTARRTALAATLVTLKEKTIGQLGRKGTNKEATDHATTVLNAAYAFAQQVSAASKIIYRAAPATRAMFRLGPGRGPQPEAHTRSLTAAQPVKTMVFKTPLADDTLLELRLTGGPTAAVRVGRSPAPDVPPTAWVLLDAATRKQVVPASALGAEGQYVVVEEGSGGAVAVRVRLG